MVELKLRSSTAVGARSTAWTALGTNKTGATELVDGLHSSGSTREASQRRGDERNGELGFQCFEQKNKGFQAPIYRDGITKSCEI
jgi:hypothetical protein